MYDVGQNAKILFVAERKVLMLAQ